MMVRWQAWVGLGAATAALLGGTADVRADPPPLILESFEWLSPQQLGGASFSVGKINGNGDFFTNSTSPSSTTRNIAGVVMPSTSSAGFNAINDTPTAVGSTVNVTNGGAVTANGTAPSVVLRDRASLDAINNQGWTAGVFFSTAFANANQAFRMDDAGRTLLDVGPRFRTSGIDAQGRVYGNYTSGTPAGLWVLPRHGPPENLGTFGADFVSINRVSENGNIAGYLAYGVSFDSESAFALVDGLPYIFPSQTASPYAFAFAVTLDNRIIGRDTDTCPDGRCGEVWVRQTDGTRFRLADAAIPLLGVLPDLFTLASAHESGWVLGVGMDPVSGTMMPFRAKIQVDIDTDGDGLLDRWETAGQGIDANGDGVIDLELAALGATPDHKDLFVELDRGGIVLPDEALARVVFAFEQAPLSNPDGTTGIRIHIQKDETDLPFVNDTVIGDHFPEGFADFKRLHFGTLAERGHPTNATQILAAKALSFRYSVIYDGLTFVGGTTPYNGIGEIGGNDFLCDLSQGVFHDGFQDLNDMASTYMHELGHTLGLEHGGLKDQPGTVSTGPTTANGKPNYPSIMNYALTHPQRWNQSFWQLDFSREELATLEEAALDEGAGIPSTSYRNYFMPYGVGTDNNRSFRLVRLDGRPTDFNGDASTQPVVAQDLNFMGGGANVSGVSLPSPGQTLRGFDDWNRMKLAVNPDSREIGRDDAEGCPNEAMLAYLDAQVPMPCLVGDCMGSGSSSGGESSSSAASGSSGGLGSSGGGATSSSSGGGSSGSSMTATSASQVSSSGASTSMSGGASSSSGMASTSAPGSSGESGSSAHGSSAATSSSAANGAGSGTPGPDGGRCACSTPRRQGPAGTAALLLLCAVFRRQQRSGVRR